MNFYTIFTYSATNLQLIEYVLWLFVFTPPSPIRPPKTQTDLQHTIIAVAYSLQLNINFNYRM